jgi:phage FluMu gp28-like protein
MPYSWQIPFHLSSILLHGENNYNLYIMKSRGISFSYSSMMELILRGEKYGENIYPVIANRQVNSEFLIGISHWLVQNAQVNFDYNKDKHSELELYSKKGKATIRGYPSGNPDAVESVRGLRPVTALIDEGAFIRNFDDLLSATSNTMQSKETQLIIGSTPSGRVHPYWQKWIDNTAAFKKIEVTAYDRNSFDYTKPITDKDKPLVWWYEIKKLENQRLDDLDRFLKEYMCMPINDNDALITDDEYENAITNEFSFDKYYYVMGVDVASLSDYAVITIFKTDGIKYEQVYLWYKQKILLSDLETEIERFLSKVEECRIDSTGQGLEVYQNLNTKHGQKIKGIDFRESIVATGNLKESIRKYMAYNLKKLFNLEKIKIDDDRLQKNHLLNMKKNLVSTHSKMGHHDIFWGIALATLPLNYKYLGSQERFPDKEKQKRKPIDDLLDNIKAFSPSNKKGVGVYGY